MSQFSMSFGRSFMLHSSSSTTSPRLLTHFTSRVLCPTPQGTEHWKTGSFCEQDGKRQLRPLSSRGALIPVTCPQTEAWTDSLGGHVPCTAMLPGEIPALESSQPFSLRPSLMSCLLCSSEPRFCHLQNGREDWEVLTLPAFANLSLPSDRREMRPSAHGLQGLPARVGCGEAC